jgi:hypothetical protein
MAVLEDHTKKSEIFTPSRMLDLVHRQNKAAPHRHSSQKIRFTVSKRRIQIECNECERVAFDKALRTTTSAKQGREFQSNRPQNRRIYPAAIVDTQEQMQ